MNLVQNHHANENQEIKDKLIITGASASFGQSLLALLGSLTLNWPEHPPVLVYDLGMDGETLETLRQNHIEVRKVPPFVPHWRKHFTWKIWCWNNAPARDVFWLDAGVVALQPLDDVFWAIEKLGYFINPSYYLLSDTATDAACLGCKVDLEFRTNKMTFQGGVVGFRKEGIIDDILKEALEVACVEEYIKSTQPLGRHDQAILSLLMHKYIKNPLMFDTMVYAGWESPRQVWGQKLWVHRKNILSEDIEYFKAHISTPGLPYFPHILPKVSPDPMPVRILKVLRKPPKEIVRKIAARLSKKEPERPIYDGVRD